MCSYKEINEWFKWKNTPVKDRKLQSVEEKFNDYTKICGGDNETDVLYNILYLYAIGLYIKTRSEPNMEYFVSNRIQSGRQYLHSLKYINSNLTVMWPGGNTLKGSGNNGYYDNPDIFFRKYKEWFLVLKGKEYAFLNVFVKRIEDEKFESLKTFVDSFKDLSEFAKYINEIVKIINNRTEKIEQYLKSKTINSDYNNN